MTGSEAVAAIKAAKEKWAAAQKAHAEELATLNDALDQAQVSMKAAAEKIATLEAQVATATASVPDDLAAEITSFSSLLAG